METILFLHGWGGDENTFAPIKTFFETRYNCVFVNFDCDPKTVRTLEDYVSQVEKIIIQKRIKQCHIMGHSFGARIAVLLAGRNPELVGKMILTGAAGLKPRFNLWLWLKIRLYKLKKRILKFDKADGKNKARKSHGSADYKKLTNAGKITFQNIINRDLASEISKLDVPTLLIWGARDRSTPPYMAKMWTRSQKSAILKKYVRSGHFCFITEPERFIRDAHEFLESGDCVREKSNWRKA